MRASPVLLACVLLAGAVTPSLGQRLEPRTWPTVRSASSQPARGLLPFSTSGTARPDSVVIKPTHWWEGGVTVGLITGLVFAGAGVALCSSSETGHCSEVRAGLIGFAVGGMLGFTVGAILGGQVPATTP
jgi:hypothetical protein